MQDVTKVFDAIKGNGATVIQLSGMNVIRLTDDSVSSVDNAPVPAGTYTSIDLRVLIPTDG